MRKNDGKVGTRACIYQICLTGNPDKFASQRQAPSEWCGLSAIVDDGELG